MIDKAISELYENKLYRSMCLKYGKENSEDLRSEVILILLEYPKDKLMNIIEKGYLLPWSLQIMRFQTDPHHYNRNRTFNKKFNNGIVYVSIENHLELNVISQDTDDIVIGETISKKVLQDSLNQKNPHFYHAKLAIERTKYKNTKELSRAVGIPYFSVRYALKEYKTYLNQWAQES